MSNTPNIAGHSIAVARAAPGNSASRVPAGAGRDKDAAAFDDLVTRDLVTRDLVTRDLVTGDLVTGDLVTGDFVTGDFVTGDFVTGDLVTGDLVSPLGGGAAGEGNATASGAGGQSFGPAMSGAVAVLSQAVAGPAEDVGGTSGSQATLPADCGCHSGTGGQAAALLTPPPTRAPEPVQNQQSLTSALAIGVAGAGGVPLPGDPLLTPGAADPLLHKPVRQRDTGAARAVLLAGINAQGAATVPRALPRTLPEVAAKPLALQAGGLATALRPGALRNPGPGSASPQNTGSGARLSLEVRQHSAAGGPDAPTSAVSVPVLPARSALAGSGPLPVAAFGETIKLVEQETHFAPASQLAPLATLHQIAEAIGSAQLSGPGTSPASASTAAASTSSGSGSTSAGSTSSGSTSSTGGVALLPLNMAKPALRLLQIQLQPADMGVVTVRMSLKDDALALDIVASNHDTATHIEQNRQALLALLRANGYVAEALMVQVADGARSQQLSVPTTDQGQASAFSSQSDMAGSDAAADRQAADGRQRRGAQGAGQHGAGESTPSGEESSGESGSLRDGLFV